MSEKNEAELRAIREEIRKLSERVGVPVPRVVRFAHAAQLLDISLTKLKGLVRGMEIMTVPVGDRRMIPMSEIDKVARSFVTPKQGRPVRERKSKTAPSYLEEAEKLAAGMRKRRKR